MYRTQNRVCVCVCMCVLCATVCSVPYWLFMWASIPSTTSLCGERPTWRRLLHVKTTSKPAVRQTQVHATYIISNCAHGMARRSAALHSCFHTEVAHTAPTASVQWHHRERAFLYTADVPDDGGTDGESGYTETDDITDLLSPETASETGEPSTSTPDSSSGETQEPRRWTQLCGWQSEVTETDRVGVRHYR